MVVRILGSDLHPNRRTEKKDILLTSLGLDPRESARNSAVTEAINIYRAAQKELARRRRVPPPLPDGVTVKELERKHVTFERGCKLITGLEKRDRAEEKYIIWREWEMGQRDDWDGMPEAEHGFSLTYLAEANASFQKYFKKALAWHKRQKRKNGGQKLKNSGQKVAKGRTNKSGDRTKTA